MKRLVCVLIHIRKLLILNNESVSQPDLLEHTAHQSLDLHSFDEFGDSEIFWFGSIQVRYLKPFCGSQKVGLMLHRQTRS